jgi:carbon storage regulator CsrA
MQKEKNEKKVLVVSRKVGEIVVIGDSASPLGEIEVVRIDGGKVRIALRFPEDIRINRKEIALA